MTAFALSALVPWQLVSNGLAFGGNGLISDSGLLRKVYFPREIPVLGAIGAALPDMAVGVVPVCALGPFLGAHLSLTILWTPLLIVALLVVQRVAAGVGDPRQAHSARATVATLNCDRYQRLLAQPAALHGRVDAAYDRLVDLDVTMEQVAAGDDHRPAQLVQPRPCRLVAAQPQQRVQAQRRGAVVGRALVPCRREPLRQRRPVRSKIVPAVTDVPRRHVAHGHRCRSGATLASRCSRDTRTRSASATVPGRRGTRRRRGTRT